jgi:hypothetical protein
MFDTEDWDSRGGTEEEVVKEDEEEPFGVILPEGGWFDRFIWSRSPLKASTEGCRFRVTMEGIVMEGRDGMERPEIDVVVGSRRSLMSTTCKNEGRKVGRDDKREERREEGRDGG